MPTVVPGQGTGTDRQDQVNYYAAQLGKIPGTYQGTFTQYRGQTWAEMFVNLANADQTIDPRQLAGAIIIVEGAQRLGQGTAAAEAGLGKFVTAANKAIPEGLQATVAGIDPLAGLAGAISAFFEAITDGKMWRSAGWLLAGMILVLTGVYLWLGKEGYRAPVPVPV